MVKSVSAGKLTVGDWLYQKVRVGRKLIKPYWEGLSEEEVKLLRKSKKKIKIKQGIPFVPSFFLAFLLFLLLRYSSWGFLKLF
jgi:prepilin signal peptidase PulO-like enzyme (type II secretory pathway)